MELDTEKIMIVRAEYGETVLTINDYIDGYGDERLIKDLISGEITLMAELDFEKVLESMGYPYDLYLKICDQTRNKKIARSKAAKKGWETRRALKRETMDNFNELPSREKWDTWKEQKGTWHCRECGTELGDGPRSPGPFRL